LTVLLQIILKYLSYACGLNESDRDVSCCKDWAISLHFFSESHPHRRCLNTEDKKKNVATEFTAVLVAIFDYCFVQLL
jgi:hypothetical protein